MRLVSWIWFWYVVVGFIMGGALTCLLYQLKNHAIKLKWFEWAAVVVILLMFMFMAQTFIASYQEMVPRAAWLTIVFMGLPMVVIGVLTARSIKKRLA